MSMKHTSNLTQVIDEATAAPFELALAIGSAGLFGELIDTARLEVSTMARRYAPLSGPITVSVTAALDKSEDEETLLLVEIESTLTWANGRTQRRARCTLSFEDALDDVKLCQVLYRQAKELRRAEAEHEERMR